MPFWIRRPTGKNASKEGQSQRSSENSKQMNEPQKTRINNLRIAERLKVTVSSVGTPLQYEFYTRDFSLTGAFIYCGDLERYPFQQNSTLLDCTLHLNNDRKVRFLSKIARIMTRTGEKARRSSGVGLRTVQIMRDDLKALEQYILAKADEGLGVVSSNTPHNRKNATGNEDDGSEEATEADSEVAESHSLGATGDGHAADPEDTEQAP